MRYVLALVLVCSSHLEAQQPTNCAAGGTVVAMDGGIWYCTGNASAAVQLAKSSDVVSIPTGATIFIDSGVCPSGYVENTALNGKTIIGTLAANGNVGTIGGADSITPAGTESIPTFTGTVNTLAVTAHTSVATKQGTAAGNVITTGTHVITGIPGGTVSAPVFTGTPFDNRSAWIKMIACKRS